MVNTLGAAMAHWPWSWQSVRSTVTRMVESFRVVRSGGRCEANGQLDGAGVTGVGEPACAGQFVRVAQPAGQQGQRLAHVRAGDEVPEAVMGSAAEAEVRLAFCGDVEPGREYSRVGARGFAVEVDRGAGGELDAFVLEVFQYLTGHPAHGGVDPHDLLDGLAAEGGVFGEQPPLIEVAHERLHREAELITGGVEPAEDQERHGIS